MSKFQKPGLYQGRALDTQWLNIIFQAHDLMCGCNKVIDHLKDILPKEECRSSSTNTDGINTENLVPEDGFDAGDLERIFAGDVEEDAVR